MNGVALDVMGGRLSNGTLARFDWEEALETSGHAGLCDAELVDEDAENTGHGWGLGVAIGLETKERAYRNASSGFEMVQTLSSLPIPSCGIGGKLIAQVDQFGNAGHVVRDGVIAKVNSLLRFVMTTAE